MKGKGKGQDPNRDTAWFPPNPYKGKDKGQKGFWKGGKGKGAYSVDDDWSSGYREYSFDAPLLLGCLTEEAAGEWTTVKPKKAARQPNPTGRSPAGCPCHIHTGRHDVLNSSDHGFSDYDRNVPLMMVTDLEEGDVPPRVASPGGAVFVHEAATAKEKGRENADSPGGAVFVHEAATVKEKMYFDWLLEKYRHQHKEMIA